MRAIWATGPPQANSPKLLKKNQKSFRRGRRGTLELSSRPEAEFSAVSVDEVFNSSFSIRFCISTSCWFFRAVKLPGLSEASIVSIGSAIEGEGVAILES